MNKLKTIFAYTLGGIILLSIVALAGSLSPTVSSTSTGTMYTLNDIYNKLDTGEEATLGNHPTSTTTSPTPTFRTLEDIYGKIPNISSSTLALGTTIMGTTGILYGDTDPSKVLSNATYPGTAARPLEWSDNVSNGHIWNEADEYCENLNEDGYTDWRLPHIGELLLAVTDLVGYGKADDNGYYFSSSFDYWAGEVYIGAYGDGGIHTELSHPENESARTLCVR